MKEIFIPTNIRISESISMERGFDFEMEAKAEAVKRAIPIVSQALSQKLLESIYKGSDIVRFIDNSDGTKQVAIKFYMLSEREYEELKRRIEILEETLAGIKHLL